MRRRVAPTGQNRALPFREETIFRLYTAGGQIINQLSANKKRHYCNF
jgi:hypothetical protein